MSLTVPTVTAAVVWFARIVTELGAVPLMASPLSVTLKLTVSGCNSVPPLRVTVERTASPLTHTRGVRRNSHHRTVRQ